MRDFNWEGTDLKLRWVPHYDSQLEFVVYSVATQNNVRSLINVFTVDSDSHWTCEVYQCGPFKLDCLLSIGFQVDKLVSVH